MKLVSFAAVLSVSAPVAAETLFEEHSATVDARPAQQLQEASCEVTIGLAGAVATVEIRQRIVNTGDTPLGGQIEAPMPRGGRAFGFAVQRGRSTEVALPVRADSVTLTGGTTGVDGVDPATLFAREGADGEARYQIVLQPIAPRDTLTLITKYAAVARPRAGALELQLAARKPVSNTAKLAPCNSVIAAQPGPGASVRQIRIGERVVRGSRAQFVLDDVPVRLAADLAIAGDRPIAWSQTQPLAAGYSATLLTVLGPVVKARSGPRRVVFVVDGSRSMDLVGRQHVTALIERIATALPAGSEIEAIVYDRKAARVFNELRPVTPANVAAITQHVATRGSTNGSDIVGAFALAKPILETSRGTTTIVSITDGVTPDLDRKSLTTALGGKPSTVDMHAIVLNPGSTTSPGGDVLRAPVNLYGGAYVEVAIDDIATAMQSVDEWMRPAWLELGLAGYHLPTEVHAGGGFTHTIVYKGAKPRLVLTGHADRPFTVAAQPAAAAPVALLADLYNSDGDLVLEADDAMFDKLRAAHPYANATTALAVLASAGKIAKPRREMVRGGGRYERLVAQRDPNRSAASSVSPAPTASAIARPTLERLFRDQLQPKAYACYQRALGANSKLAGTVKFAFRMGRGEVTEVTLIGLGDATLDACLLDAAYGLTPPAPDFRINADDQTIANYPLAFARREDKAVVVLGDADSTSPIDIEALQRATDRAIARKKRVEVDAKTPLGGMKAPKSP